MGEMVAETQYIQESLPVLTDDDIEIVPFAPQFEGADTEYLKTLAIDLDSDLCTKFDDKKYEQLMLIEDELAIRDRNQL